LIVCRPMKTEDFIDCKAILLDFGGTLDSDGEHWLDRFYELYEMVGLDLPREEIKRVFYLADEMCCRDPEVDRLGLRPLMKHHIHLQFSALQLNGGARQERMVDTFCAKTEGVLRRNALLLSRLKPRYRLGVVSNFYGNVTVLCEEAGLAPSLGVILDSTRIGIGKPDPRIFELALRELGANPEETVFVGDSYERDMMPARRLGMKTIWMKGPHPRLPEDPEPADGVISSLAELEFLLL
jgi:putative hydrolase of the HAD superfamily